MSWLDRLKMGSWNGLEFLVTDAEVEDGRRVVTHEFPGGEVPYVEDLGRRPVVWRFLAIVHGVDYDLPAAQLAAEMAKGGVGTLVHPQLGPRRARIESVRRRDSSSQGRMATFEITAQEDLSATPAPSPIDPNKAIAAAAAATTSAAAASVEEGLLSEHVPEFVRTATAEAVAAGAKVMRTLRLIRGATAEVTTYQTNVTSLIGNATSLAISPVSLAAAIVGAVDSIGDAGMNALDAFKCYRGLFGLDDGAGDATSVFGKAADSNRRLVSDLFRAAALAGAVRAAADVPWGSEAEALSVRDELEAELQDLQSRARDDLYQALADLRVQIVANIPDPTLRVPQLTSTVLATSLPALVVAYRHLGDAREADALVELNHVRDPLRVPGGVELKVAARADSR